MPRSFVEVDVVLPLADRKDASNTCSAVCPYLEGKDCRIHVVHVVQKEAATTDHEAVERRADDIFAVATECFQVAEIPVSAETRYGRNVAEVILEAAEEHTAASIILTPRERSIWRRLRSQNVLGSLATAAERPVIIIPS